MNVFTASETNGSWGTAGLVSGLTNSRLPEDADVYSLSCGAAGYCSAGGYFGGAPAYRWSPFVVNEATASAAALALTAAKVTYGNEETTRLSATVTSPAGGTPAGTVSVTAGETKVCTITLASGTGACTLAAARLQAGKYQLTAAYSGNNVFLPAASAAQALTVVQAASRTSLSLSKATITYGHETAERLSVIVTPQFGGTPGGKVTVKAGRTTICVITLSKTGKGSCALAATRLKPATYTLTASYGGSSDYKPSASAAKTLKVAK